MIIFHDEHTLLHETVELLGAKLIPAIESPSRIRAIVQSLRNTDYHDLRVIEASKEDQVTAIELAKETHQYDYLNHIQQVFQQWLDANLVEADDIVLPECFRLHSVARSKLLPPKDIYARAGYYAFDMSSGISQYSWTSIIASANLAIVAARELLSSSPRTELSGTTSPPRSVLALCRPPGHHCTGTQSGGYCYINNIAVAITTLRSSVQHDTGTRHAHAVDASPAPYLKFAILDIDFHHGNGTQSQFYNDPAVFYVSIHGEDEFPYYTGAADERGPPDHPAYDTNLNLPLATGSSFAEYREKLGVAVTAIQKYRPDYFLVSLGFDTFHLDPLGKFDITTEDYEVMARTIREGIDVPAVIVLEGGYVVDRLGENLLMFLKGWESAESQVPV